jgi:hypothetical protein
MARALEDLRTSLGTTDIPDPSIDLIVGAAAGVLIALTADR